MGITPESIKQQKSKSKILSLTAYDYTFARLLDEAGVDIILVGDSLGMVVCGDKDTKSVTIDQIVYHTKAVARGVKHALIVADMPVNTYQTPPEALTNARKLIDVGAQAVKIEEVGDIVAVVSGLVQAGIPVMGHVGLTPQTAAGFKVQGKDETSAHKIINDARAFDRAGVFAIVMECIPSALAAELTRTLSCPTIGIGAGAVCDGQVLVSYDALGLFTDFKPKFVRHFLQGSDSIKRAVGDLRRAIESGDFPAEKEQYR